ncbi:MAG TPA: FAD-dependent oxidoreductase [Nocardioides sp.]|uniref:phytoene desaturase family protein n=1 Tax=Nocardioides sp. TaxID=35761 RepID=UPI002D0DAA5A|nr:FAD-dependent oxidoreductase [Nocardioides sp.]HQR26904.1 FAD-dependent oxidoreductase [Nocardioides sp.]
MARVVVVGGGLGGTAAAARLAKLGHEVALVERSGSLGGVLLPVAADGFTWPQGPSVLLLPAVVRDLFRKTGRPLERELELLPVPVVREHRFADGSSVRLPAGSRAAQLHAVEALGSGLGRQWVTHVDSLAADWELMRRDYFERPWDPASGPRAVAARLASRDTVDRRLRRGLHDPRLRLLAAHPLRSLGQDPRRVPAWMAVWPYVEQRFGGWSPAGGTGALAEAVASRLTTRGVDVHTSTRARDVVVRAGRAVAVATDAGDLPADVVVCAVDPHLLPTLAAYVRRTDPAPLPPTTHLGLAGGQDDPAPEIVLHGDPDLVVRTTGAAPPGASAWTVHGARPEALLTELARRGLDVRDRVVVRVDRSPQELLDQWGGSPLGVRWRGRGTVRRRLGPTTPVQGVYAAGAHATPGAGLPFVGLSAALVAQAVGPA